MQRRILLIPVAAALLAGAVLVSAGRKDPRVNLSSVTELWGDALRDTDQTGLKLTRVSDDEEMTLGNRMAAALASGQRENYQWQPYVQAVGSALVPHVRRTAVRYQFHVVESPEINAWALPGGQIYVTTGMLAFLTSEAELAAVLGHEISHVDLRHCVERYQYGLALKKVGAGAIGELADFSRFFLTLVYSKDQEQEADEQGLRLGIEAGYDPQAAPKVFQRMKARFGETEPGPSRTPAGEVARSLAGALRSYFQSHPTSDDRGRRLEEVIRENNRRLSGRSFYRGARNYLQRVPRTQTEFPGERVVM